VAVSDPKWMEIVLDYRVRGGIHTVVTVESGDRGA
ncbi:MAG: NADPH-dependent 7-cyano-7-deazaguanine reductase QueF, partial [Acidobacteria bacterium]|nr:NADPH-dependent 7-cyano-7-deazaguanine reductase QueF [Acidobacteriota bacterium]